MTEALAKAPIDYDEGEQDFFRAQVDRRLSDLELRRQLEDAPNVVVTEPADNEVLAWDDTTQRWINQTAAEAGLAAASHTHTSGDVFGPGVTVAGLPGSPSVGWIARVTDANSPTLGATVAGGGAAHALVWYNNANWTVIGV